MSSIGRSLRYLGLALALALAPAGCGDDGGPTGPSDGSEDGEIDWSPGGGGDPECDNPTEDDESA